MLDIDLRKEFAFILKQYGTDIYLQRRIHAVGDPEDIYQYPGGAQANYYSDKLEKYTVRYTFAARKTSLTAITEEKEEGLVHTVRRVFYFPHYADPKEQDRIYQKDVRYPGRFEIYMIEYAQPFCGRHGQIVYYEIGSIRHSEPAVRPDMI